MWRAATLNFEAHLALGEVRRTLEWDWRGSGVCASDRACEMDPLCVVVNSGAAWVRYLVRDYDGAIARSREASRSSRRVSRHVVSSPTRACARDARARRSPCSSGNLRR
ncbi:MAG TPA: hypothetical protein VIK41_15475 [Gemmatimonadaceae bacterium]